MREYLTIGLLVVTSAMQVFLAIDRWVHKQSTDGANLAERVTRLEHTVEQINARASEVNSKLQRMIGRLEGGRFRGDGG